jgi:putative membrane-bound dehydrogenase-like protein
MNFKDNFLAIAALLGALVLVPMAGAAPTDPLTATDQNEMADKLPRVPPTPAAEAAKTFQVLDSFHMDLLASEPLVASPVAMTYDENGRAFVCEMRDYPYTDKARHKPRQENPTDDAIGRIRLLEDLDGDGVFDKATIFAEQISWPTGVACWKGGVFVAATPDIWYFKDTDGDGKADERRKVFTGFRKFNVQAVMNNLVWGLDNQIHGAGSSNGGRIRASDRPGAKPLVLSRNDFKIDPTTGEMQLLSGGARFGGTFDDWGNRFLCNIRNPAQHVILPEHYLARNHFLAAPSALFDMAESGDQLPVYPISPPETWRTLRAKRWAGDRENKMPRSELVGSGVVTSASGITSYRGAAYPEKYRGDVFITECAGNLFYRLQLAPDGVTFKASRVDGKAEMVASTDNWFRPVNFVNAPDGTLHVIDMYRENIEHPWSIPDDIHAAVDLEAGRDMGRIWRLTPPGFKTAKPPRLGSASSAELVVMLENPNGWWRETAQRLLFERQDKSVVPQLHHLVKNGHNPVARLHALWTLHGLNELEEEDVLAGLNDQVARIRENAVKLAESCALSERLIAAVLPLANDSDARVRFQTAFTLGELNDSQAFDGLSSIAERDAADLWIRTAVLSSVSTKADQLLSQLLSNAQFVANPESDDIVRELAQIVGARGKESEIQHVLEAVEKTHDKKLSLRVVASIGQGLRRSGQSLRQVELPENTKRFVGQILDDAAQTALDEEASLEVRVASIQLLVFDDFDRIKPLLSDLLSSEQPQEVQCEAVRTVGSFTSPDAAELLLANWRTQTPQVRTEVVTAALAVRNRALPLLKAIEAGLIPANQVPIYHRETLERSRVAEVKELAKRLFRDAAPGPRKKVVDDYQRALSLRGEADRGRILFEQHCISCHRVGNLGDKDLGPNLATIRAWNPEQVLVNILDPNREVAPSFVAYTVVTTAGRIIHGLIVEEGAASITVRRPDGTAERVLRSEVDEISGSGLSIMPDGLEKNISQQNMADLIAFLLTTENVADR